MPHLFGAGTTTHSVVHAGVQGLARGPRVAKPSEGFTGGATGGFTGGPTGGFTGGPTGFTGGFTGGPHLDEEDLCHY